MFERFTKGAIKVIMLAQEESRRMGHNFVGSEQILMGVLGEGSSDGAKALKQAGVTMPLLREAVKKIIGQGSGFVAVEIPFTPRAKRILETSWEFAKSTNVKYIGPEHLLVGVLSEDDGVAVRALSGMSVSPNSVREDLEKLMKLDKGAAMREPFERLPETTKCEWCGEMVQIDAKLCRHCQRPRGEEARRCPDCGEVIWMSAASCRFCKKALN